MSFVKEFKSFALRGNLIDMAIGFVMGTGFAKVTSAFIDGMVMPLVGMVQGKDLSDWKMILKASEMDASGKEIASEVAIKYGTFITVSIEFVIIAMVMFMVIKAINKAKKEEEAAPATPPAQEVLLSEIRDLLKK